jgi:flagellar motility protein MotE (MotC chaperone)
MFDKTDFGRRQCSKVERGRDEAARERDRERREKATAKAALDKTERKHAKRIAAIQTEVEALEKRSLAEDHRWEKERERLQAAVRRARE